MLFPIFFEHAHLEETREHLLKKGELLVQEACQLLICDMMRLDPNLRLNAETLLLRVSELKMNNSIIGVQ